ncbi:MAG: DUF2298 domain-containing protein, partial [Ardenticatenales bacterium]
MTELPETEQPMLPPEPEAMVHEPTSPRRDGGWRAVYGRTRRFEGGFTVLALALIVFAGFYLRTVGIDWDAGQHLHPDERFLTDVSSSLHMPLNLQNYLDTDTSPLNPRNQGKAFFSYGTWPITIARVMADADGPLGLGMTDYGSIYIVGRYMSGLLDLLTVLLVFALGVVLYDKRVGLLAAVFMAFMAFDIQQSHFFTVDAPLTCFVTLTLLGLALAVRRGTWWPLLVAGIGLAMALGSKITVWLLVPIAVLAIVVAELRRAHPESGLAAGSSATRLAMWRAAGKVALLGAVSYVALRFAQPDMWAGPGWPNVVGNSARYAEVTSGPYLKDMHWQTLLDVIPGFLQKYLLPDPRWLNNMGQIKSLVTGFGMDWPPNHQWWGRLGYIFPLRNMVLWGMGPLLGVAAWLSWLCAGVAIWRGRRRHLLPWLWVTVYFGYTGIQWVKTMRYTLPIYPSLALLAAWGLIAWVDWARARADGRPGDHAPVDPPADDGRTPAPRGRTGRIRAAFERAIGGRNGPRLALAATAAVVVGTMAWGFMFSRIYTRHHSRVAGSHWVYHNLPTAVGVHIAADPQQVYSGPWLPAQAPGDLRAVGGVQWPLDSRWTGPMRLLLPDESWQQRWTGDHAGAKPDLWTPARGTLADEEALPRVTVDAIRLAYARGDADVRRSIRVVLSAGASLGPDGTPERPIAEGALDIEVGGEESNLQVPLAAPAELHLGQEVYVWVAVEGGAITVRPSILAYETHWDDIVPEGMYGYAGYDDANSEWVDGLFVETDLEMYGEDYPDWLSQTIDQISTIDYWVSSSNRVYGAVAQLPMRYPATIAFYQRVMFGQEMGWKHLASITSFPNFGPIRINDQGAEEAYHVYDHPEVDVFERPHPFDGAALKAYLAPQISTKHWAFPPVATNPITRWLDALLGRIPVDRAAAAADLDSGASKYHPVDDILLSKARADEQRAGGTWRSIFNPYSLINRYPLLAVLLWYFVLLALGIAAFPLVAVALPGMPDRGWSVARTAGLLLTSYIAWVAASTPLATNTWWLLAASAIVVALASTLVARSARFDVRRWWRDHRDTIVRVEVVFGAIFAVFLAIRFGNPDLWHISKGGEKPMDFAYLNATLRTLRFPPYDPWFAGSKLNYYYYGFVFIGALIKLTGVVPWIAYNLAIPTLAALTGTGVYGIVSAWLSRGGVPTGRANRMGRLAAVMTVLMGNLYQAPWMAKRMAEIAPPVGDGPLANVVGRLDGAPLIGSAMRTVRGLWAFVSDPSSRYSIPLDHWYWNASRAIPSGSNVQPITEFPFFTYLYADLHAHMMAMPIAVLACAVVVSWALPVADADYHQPWVRPDAVVRLALGALAIGALWPTNTWDFPSYGLIAAGGIALGEYIRRRRLDLVWFGRVAVTGGALLALSLALFLPYHLNYITPYSEFKLWTGFRTPPSAYLTVHGIFLFALVSWSVTALITAAEHRAERRALFVRLAVLAAGAAVGAFLLWRWSVSTVQYDLAPDGPHPGWGTPLIVLAVFGLGLVHVLRRDATPAARLVGLFLAVGALLT